MITPKAGFNMKKDIKRSLSLFEFKDSHARGEFKRLMIEAQIFEGIQPRKEKEKKESED
jgi:hypothetical protein